MRPIKIIFLFIFFVFFQSNCFSQTEKFSAKQLEEMLDKAWNQLYQLEYSKSLLTSNKVLTEAYKNKNNVLIARAYNVIGLNFAEFTNINKTLYFYRNALYFANLTNDDLTKAWVNNNIGNIYTQENIDFKKGINYYKKALFFSLRLKDNAEVVNTNINIASAYFEIKDFKNGIKYLNSIEKQVLNKGDLETKIILNSLKGYYYNSQNQADLSIAYYNRALELGKDNKNEIIDSEIILSYKELSKIYKKKGDTTKALYFLTLKDELSDKYNDKERLKKAKIIGAQIEIDDYKRQIEKIEFEKKMQTESLRLSNIIVALFIVIFVVLLVLVLLLYRNVRYRKETNREIMSINTDLKIAKEKAEEVSSLKSQFVSTISHELRTPLYGVVGITNILSEENEELTDSPHLKALKFSAQYLLALVNDILQINKIEEKRVVLENVAFTIQDELETIIHSLQFLATKNENTVFIEVDSKIPKFLLGDKLRLSQIIMNLVGNALKFTTKGNVYVKVNLANVINNKNYLEFQIIDTGIGIEKVDLENIYEKFVQVGRNTDDYQGTGLGLSIVKNLIELFESQIYVTSVINEGTAFKFTIAFEEVEFKADEVLEVTAQELITQHKISVLVVEDNKINQMVTRKIIEKNNFECDICENGILAIEKLETTTYDVILMDINMPIIDGFETTRRIRQKGILTPIVALTAFDKDEITAEAYSSGMNEIIIKPFDPLKLFQIISSQVQNNKLKK